MSKDNIEVNVRELYEAMLKAVKLKEIKHCKGHRRYRNNCEDCREATA